MSFELGGITITSKPPRSRTGRRGCAGYQLVEPNKDELTAFTSEEADHTKGSGADGVILHDGKRIRLEEDADFCTGDGKKRKRTFEYRDHTADIQLHSWGSTKEQAFESCALAMFHYMTGLERVQIDESYTTTYNIKANDQEKLLFAFLDELLYNFVEDKQMVCCDVTITEADWENCSLVVKVQGEKFDPRKHEKGTEIKAITYSATQIITTEERVDVYIIVDI